MQEIRAPSRRPSRGVPPSAVHRDRALLGSIAAAVEDPVLVFDREGRMVLASPAGRALLDTFATPTDLVGPLRNLVPALPPASFPDGRWAPVPGVDLIETARGPLMVRYCRWCRPLVSAPVIALRLDRRILPRRMEPVTGGRFQPVRSYLARRHGLTEQEAVVALLLAQRRPNREIARELLISVHTARHHTESVLAKLGVRRRADVARGIVSG